MSRFFYLIIFCLSSAFLSPHIVADEGESDEPNSDSDYKEFVGIDMSQLSKEELLPGLEGLELPEDRPLKVMVVPIKEPIGKPSLFLLRRAVKSALETNVDALVLDMDTPGGGVLEALDMMEILNEFPGYTVTYVNDEAISAGAIISSVTDFIYFSPLGIMGSAAAIQATGEEIPETMQAKLYSYLDARIESYSIEKQLRIKVLRAMIDKELELVVDDYLISPKGKLLTLTAPKALAPFGENQEPLIAAGIAESIDEIFTHGFGVEDAEIGEFQKTWSEDIAAFLVTATPILFGLGFVMIVVEIKTPSFGLLGILGILFILTAFFGQNVAGLAGFEAVVLLFIGIVLLAVEVFVIPGTLVSGILGVFCIIGAMLWSFADVWPVVPAPGEDPVDWKINTDSLAEGMQDIGLGLAIAVVVMFAIWRLLPKSPFYKSMVHQDQTADPSAVVSGGGRYVKEKGLPDLGTEGVVVTDLRPLGLVEVDGNRFEATTNVGDLAKGHKIVVVGYRSYALLVESKS